MTTLVEAKINAADLEVAFVVSSFNGFITERLLEGAMDAYTRHGGDLERLTVIKVPGAFELPLACLMAARTARYDAIVALGCVIRGDTPHFDHIAAESVKGLAHLNLSTLIPIVYGVLTCDTLEQAIDRAGAKGGNRGFDAVLTAVEMARLLVTLRS